ncbi:hypothetical protein [Mucilaginibacter aquariorum]|uniref:Uncharacterized protein n=1 Tax=Mucilaginibacter aquariorum TaxID=2967225 RepID=A0ABT1T559_9SPHI|nr:hypothetical protein [Mucilaginibacter aquariorum]MCQ6959759.1 hypothetical protein [Mucilaginibacter aquariorum]
MITLDKLNIYKNYGGDVDGWARMNANSKDINGEDWHLISSLLQDLFIVKSGLAAEAFILELDNKLVENIDNEASMTFLRSLVK